MAFEMPHPPPPPSELPVTSNRVGMDGYFLELHIITVPQNLPSGLSFVSWFFLSWSAVVLEASFVVFLGGMLQNEKKNPD